MLTKDAAMAYSCPRWDDLPSLDLYMDQVVVLIQEALAVFCAPGEVIITPSMINNYVKQKIITPPVKKKYSKNQITRLIVISLFKRVFSISEITAVIEFISAEHGTQPAYDLFCQKLEEMLKNVLGNDKGTIEYNMRGSQTLDMLNAALTALIAKLMVQNRLEAKKDNK